MNNKIILLSSSVEERTADGYKDYMYIAVVDNINSMNVSDVNAYANVYAVPVENLEEDITLDNVEAIIQQSVSKGSIMRNMDLSSTQIDGVDSTSVSEIQEILNHLYAEAIFNGNEVFAINTWEVLSKNI